MHSIKTLKHLLLILAFSCLAIHAQNPYVVVLGIAQDGGAPQAGTKPDIHKPTRSATCLGLIDPVSGQRWLFEATPDLPQQLRELDKLVPTSGIPGLDGIFLTHGHIGHYLGLAYLGHEVMGSRDVPVYAMPRMLSFLSNNGPWDQLVRYRNIRLIQLEEGGLLKLNQRLSVTPVRVPHREEYSEVVAFRIRGPNRAVLFLPDIDSWQDWEENGIRIEDEISKVDVAYVDGTFFSDGEIPGRDMSQFPHPRIRSSISRFRSLPSSERQKVRFIHLNHTNPALEKGSTEFTEITNSGFRVAQELEKEEL